MFTCPSIPWTPLFPASKSSFSRLRLSLTQRTRASPWSWWRSRTSQRDVEPPSTPLNSGEWSNSPGLPCPRISGRPSTLGRTSTARTPTLTSSPGKNNHFCIFLILPFVFPWLYQGVFSDSFNLFHLILATVFQQYWKLHFPQLFNFWFPEMNKLFWYFSSSVKCISEILSTVFLSFSIFVF